MTTTSIHRINQCIREKCISINFPSSKKLLHKTVDRDYHYQMILSKVNNKTADNFLSDIIAKLLITALLNTQEMFMSSL